MGSATVFSRYSPHLLTKDMHASKSEPRRSLEIKNQIHRLSWSTWHGYSRCHISPIGPFDAIIVGNISETETNLSIGTKRTWKDCEVPQLIIILRCPIEEMRRERKLRFNSPRNGLQINSVRQRSDWIGKYLLLHSKANVLVEISKNLLPKIDRLD